MKSTYLFFFIGLSLSFTSCKSAKKAEQTANAFFTLIVQQNPDKAAKLLDNGSFNLANAPQQLAALCENATDGKMTSFKKKPSFNTNIKNGITVVKLTYTLTYENTSYNRNVSIINRGNGFRIASIQ